jgi:hypothetical protein
MRRYGVSRHAGNAGLNIPCRNFHGVRLQEGDISGRRRYHLIEIKLSARTRESESAQEATLYAEKETRDM